MIIRADASTEMGTGHVMRCLALGQAWEDAGGDVTFVTCCDNARLVGRLEAEGFEVKLLGRPYPDLEDWGVTGNVLRAHPDAWVVLDGYHFDHAYQRLVKDSGNRLLAIDDMAHLKRYCADIVLNQNLHADQVRYCCEPYTSLLLGTRYVLLRREFLSWSAWRREVPRMGKHVLVTLGGSDPRNYTLEVIGEIQKMDLTGLETTVAVGASNPHLGALEAAVRASRTPMRLARDADNMPELMAWADVVVSGAGTTIWELLFLGTPTLALVSAENQRSVAEQLHARKVGKMLEMNANGSINGLAGSLTSLLGDSGSRSYLSEGARHLVDGQGAARVIAFMERKAGPGLRLRQASTSDCRTVWEWANDPVVREASFSTESIPWDGHVKWFEAKLLDPHCHFYIVLDEAGSALGNVRFDVQQGEAEVSVAMSGEFRGRGYGGEAIRLASVELFRKEPITRIHAHIRESNLASIRAFSKAGYTKTGVLEVKGTRALQMALQKRDVCIESTSHGNQ